jgi:hypothetical protein
MDIMTDTIRCPSCRGAKKVPKLGGMIGECNTCIGKGTILLADKPAKPEPVTLVDVISKELINAVADSVPATTIEIKQSPVEPDVKIDGKKALYKRKKA